MVWESPIKKFEAFRYSLFIILVEIFGLYKNSKEKKDRRDVINYFRPEKGLDENETRHPIYGSEQEDMGAYLYSSYTHSDMMERMSLNGFGSDLMYFKSNLYEISKINIF